mmetsp:Transcript_38165/g.56818  ORF Transcript_38165/g.56818 Transcript_38165/m.56818 type:complete len:139 (+) Transcript_38165:1744-2160(+)
MMASRRLLNSYVICNAAVKDHRTADEQNWQGTPLEQFGLLTQRQQNGGNHASAMIPDESSLYYIIDDAHTDLCVLVGSTPVEARAGPLLITRGTTKIGALFEEICSPSSGQLHISIRRREGTRRHSISSFKVAAWSLR